jgi:hypothetical protein
MKQFTTSLLSSILLLLILSCNHKQNPSQANGDNSTPGIDQTNKPSVNDTNILYSWAVRGCAEKSVSRNTKSPAGEDFKNDPDLPMPGDNEIKAEGDSIIYSRFVRHGCCRKAEVSSQRQDKVITIVEYWTGQICKCMCSSTIKTVIQQLPKGEYQVYAIETGTDPISNKPHDGRDTVMSKKVVIQ